MAVMPRRSLELEKGEFALIVGEEDGSMTVRVDGAEEPVEGQELSDAAEIVLALAQRLLHDPEFHDDMLEWWDEHNEDEEKKEEDADQQRDN